MPADDSSHRTSNTARNAQVIIAVILTGVALVWLAPILTPLALAVFLMLMIDAMARDLHARVPVLGPDASLAAAIAVCILVFGVTFYFLASHSAGFLGKLFVYQPRLNALLQALAHTLHVRLPRTVAGLIQSLDPGKYLPVVAGAVQTLLQQGLLVLIYLGFLLASRRGFERKAVRLFRGREGRHEALQVFLRVRDSLERYLYIQTVCGAFIAVGAWALMMLVGLQNAFFWALLIFALGYIPIIGAAIGIVAPTLFALLQFPSLWQAAVLGIGML
ncbi:MAG TPA: AI-2E family transporter, partial [Caulobacteraceae bacterium]|nr:AI-2E family transporter [Caulobacteraceae bacterium]